MAREYTVMRLGKGKKKIELCLERRIRKYGYAGLIISNLFQEEIIIRVNESRLDEYCIRRGYISAREDGTHPKIIIDTDSFNGIKRGVIADRFMLFHEIGHYCCGHLTNPPELEAEFSKRIEHLENDEVSADEVAADCFAAEYLGPEQVILALQEAMEQRMTNDLFYGTADDPISKMAIYEYQLRIDAVNERFGLLEEDEKYY